MKIGIYADTTDRVLAFAAGELKYFLGRLTGHLIEIGPGDGFAPDLAFRIGTDASMRPFSFAGKDDFRGNIALRGHDSACALHAVYETLERLGVYFEFTGPVLPEKCELAALDGLDFDIVPFARFRSIKHYINFTCDLSIFSQKEAREVILNSARLKYNWISFHLLDGMWLPQLHAPDPDRALQAGNLFYNSKHDVPDDDFMRTIVDNRETVYIPEIETAVPSRTRRSELCTAWLRDLMEYAVSCGLKVHVGIELAQHTDREQDAEHIRNAVLTYPAISMLELFSAESGGPQISQTAEEQREHLRALFNDEELLENPKVKAAFKSNLRQYWGIMHWLAKQIAVEPLVKDFLAERNISLMIGQYSKCYNTLITGKEVMRKYVPAGVVKSHLIGYGAVKVDTALDAIGYDADDWRDSVLVNWFEFDGSMYLMQNATAAIHRSIAKAAAAAGPGGQIEGMYILTWRIGENKLSIKYASQALIDGSLTPDEFYRTYFTRFGATPDESGEFASIMQGIEDVENFCNYRMFNVGFCMPNVCYPNPADPLAAIRGDYAGIGAEAENAYADLAARARKLLEPIGSLVLIRYMRMLISRLDASAIHMKIRREIQPMVALCDGRTAETLSEDEKTSVRRYLDQARASCKDYIRTVAAEMPDRGTQGLLVAYWQNFMNYWDHIQEIYTTGETICTHRIPPFTGTDDAVGVECPMPAN